MKRITAPFFVFCLVLVFALGFFTHRGFEEYICQDILETEGSADYSLLNSVLAQIQNKFVSPEEIDEDALMYGAAAGMVDALNDPYSTFFDPLETEEFKEDIAGSFEGVGVQIGIKNDQLQVIAPLKDTPGYDAGIMAKDIITKVDGEKVDGMAIEEVVDMIRGEKGTPVTLTIYRESWGEERDVVITRDTIKVPTTELEMLETADGKTVAHFTLSHFSDIIYSDFKEDAYQILDSDAEGIILDLRNNPGGLLDQAESIAGWFLKKGDVVLTEKGRDGEESQYKSPSDGKFLSYPIVILINEGSASASEILAAAVRDNRSDVIIVGETSFGKGAVQQLMELSDGSSVKITTAKWYTPNGEGIEGVGISPDEEVIMTTQDYEDNLDPQLDKALEIIEKII